MTDINSILSKHFADEATAEEQRLAEEYRVNNIEEYKLLKAVWTSTGGELIEVDTAKALSAVESKLKITRPKIRSLYKKTMIAASVAASFLIAFMFLQHYSVDTQDNAIIVATSNTLEKKEIHLPDGTSVFLNSNSTLSYPKAFNQDDRLVSLTGEAFFDVTRDENRPFRISTQHSEVEVLGTSFNVNTTAEATEVSVTTGKVNVVSVSNHNNSQLTPGRSVVVTDNELREFPTNNQNYLSWNTGVFVFNEEPLTKVINDLNTYYDNKLVLNIADSDCLFTAKFEKRELKEILQIIELTCNIKIRSNQNTYELY